jgi:nucleoside-specific channel-forming protein
MGAIASLMVAAPGAATDFSTIDIHQNDYKWMGMNFIRSEGAKLPYGNQNDTYFELEFGGRSGMLDLYGYVDMFNLLDSRTDQRATGDNIFIKLEPRLSLDALLKKDLSFGPVKELYIANITTIGDHGAGGGLKQYYIGPGSDVMVPWLGKMGMNLLARYVYQDYGASDEGKFNGYMFDTNWFKPFVKFENGTFIAYQGYIDQQFGAYKLADDPADHGAHSKSGTEFFNGFYWHSKRYAIGYGLKYFKNMALTKDGVPAGIPTNRGGLQSTTGLGSYFDFTYKF